LRSFLKTCVAGASSHSARQPFMAWCLVKYLTTKIHYRVHNGSPLLPILSQIHPLHTSYTISLRFILKLFSHLRLDLPSGLFLSGFPTKILYAFVIAPMHTTRLAHRINLITIMPLCAAWRLFLSLRSKYASCNFSSCYEFYEVEANMTTAMTKTTSAVLLGVLYRSLTLRLYNYY